MGVADSFRSENTSDQEKRVFLKGSDFDNEMSLTVVGMNVFTPQNSDYGVKNQYGPGGSIKKEHWFVAKKLLKEGESFQYVFTQNGEEKIYETTSLGFYFAFTNVNPEPGEIVKIKRIMKSQTDVDWIIERI